MTSNTRDRSKGLNNKPFDAESECRNMPLTKPAWSRKRSLSRNDSVRKKFSRPDTLDLDASLSEPGDLDIVNSLRPSSPPGSDSGSSQDKDFNPETNQWTSLDQRMDELELLSLVKLPVNIEEFVKMGVKHPENEEAARDIEKEMKETLQIRVTGTALDFSRSVQIEELEDLSEKYRDLSWTIKMKEEDLNQRIAIAISEVKSFRGKMKRTFLSIID